VLFSDERNILSSSTKKTENESCVFIAVVLVNLRWSYCLVTAFRLTLHFLR